MRSLAVGANASPSRTWTTISCLEPYGITTTRTSWPKCMANATPTSSTSMVYINWINPNCPNHPTRSINRRWCVHRTRTRLISNGVPWVQQQPARRLFTCPILTVIIILITRQQLLLPLLTQTTGIIPVPMTMQRILPHRIRISRRLIGSVQQRVRPPPLAREDFHQRAQHLLFSRRHYPIETEESKPYCFLVYEFLFICFSLFFSSELNTETDKNHTLLSSHSVDCTLMRHLAEAKEKKKNICMQMWQWMSI